MYLTVLVCLIAILGSFTVLPTQESYYEIKRVRRRVLPHVSARQSSAAKCEPGASGLFAHPQNCAQFLNCNHGQTFIQDCGPGTAFNDLIKVCDWPHNVDCGERRAGAFVNNELHPDEITQVDPTYIYPMDVRSGFDSQPLASSDTRTQRKYFVADDNTHGTDQFISSSHQFPYQQYPSIPLTPQTRTVEIKLPDQDFFDESVLLPMPVLSSTIDNIDGNGLVNGNSANKYKTHQADANTPQPNINRSRFDSNTPEANIKRLPARQNPPALHNRNNVESQYPQLDYLSRRVVNEFDNVFWRAQHATTKTTAATTPAPTTAKQIRASSTTKASRVKMVYPHGFEEVGAKCEETGFDLHPHPFECTKYATCESGVIRIHSCKDGFMFNPTLNFCDYTRNVPKCQLKPHNLHTPKSIADEINEIHDGGSRREKMDGLSRMQPVGKMTPKPTTESLPSELPTYLHPPKPTAPQSFTGSSNNNHPHHYPSNSHHHGTSNKHANHLGAHDSNQGPNYRSNAPPPNIDAIFASQNKQTTLHEEGFLCQFDCHNGKCITFDQLCDGKNDCGNRYDEQSCPHINYQVRLSNDQGRKHSGSVEVRAFGKWGYVCDDQFTMTEANVVCRELGFNMGAAEVKTNSFYPANANMPSGESMFLMDNVQCNGNETSLKDCDFNGWGVSDCTPKNVVGVVCKTTIMQCPPNHWLCQESEECIPWSFMCDNIKDCTDGTDESDMHCKAKIEYRLTGGNELEGRVEVKYRGMWGTVCDDDFGAQEASVICRSLGFYGQAVVINSRFGPGTGPIWLDEVNCEGNETSIDKCMHFEWSENNCNHTEDVAVRCSYGPDGKSGKYISAGMESQRLTNRQTHDYSRNLDLTNENMPDFSNTCGQIKVTGEDESEEKFERFRVIGGSRAKHGHHPWQATIRTRTKYGSMHWCGAVIISEKHILTAAHCLVGFPTGAYVVRVGDHHSDVYEKSEWETFIEKWFIHEDFRKGQRMNNDIAVVQLKQPIQFTNYIQPICLPEKEMIYEAGRNCTISGWGTIQYGKSTPSNDLKAATVPLIAQQICRRKDVYGDEIMNTMFCAGFLNKTGIDACDGDSGGPLVCADDFGVHSLYGVISWGQRCGDATKPGVYVKITEYLNWIKEKMAMLH